MSEAFLGWLTGLMTALIFISIMYTKYEAYLVQSDGMKIEKIIPMENRGTCLVAMEGILGEGPQPWAYQCVDK